MISNGFAYFNNNLEPLIRYLQSNTGRPWSKVYSELCSNGKNFMFILQQVY